MQGEATVPSGLRLGQGLDGRSGTIRWPRSGPNPDRSVALLGPATFLLDDGSRWHASRLRKVPAPLSEHSAMARAQSPFPYNMATDPGPPPAPVTPPASAAPGGCGAGRLD